MSDLGFLRIALEQARRSPPKPTNFCVGAVLVSPSSEKPVLVTGYTLECPGNTHAEQSCFIKLAETHGIATTDLNGETEAQLGPLLPNDTVLYTTMEPCNKRSPGNFTCVERILKLQTSDGKAAIKRVVCGVSEPETFVGENVGRKRLDDVGIEVVHVSGLEDEILKVATAGHIQPT
nr:hypothetical protein B0A51_13436 [Rachicladosporium sp. CCFEE 5018]